jgi:hypothetical protein
MIVLAFLHRRRGRLTGRPRRQHSSSRSRLIRSHRKPPGASQIGSSGETLLPRPCQPASYHKPVCRSPLFSEIRTKPEKKCRCVWSIWLSPRTSRVHVTFVGTTGARRVCHVERSASGVETSGRARGAPLARGRISPLRPAFSGPPVEMTRARGGLSFAARALGAACPEQSRSARGDSRAGTCASTGGTAWRCHPAHVWAGGDLAFFSVRSSATLCR